MNQLGECLRGVEIGEAVTHWNLTMFPLFGGDVMAPDYLTLDEALATGNARVAEVSESGSVPELLFDNQCDRPVLLLDGEELVGAKQNRIINLTVLVPANSKVIIPVSCVEAGRWHSVSREFRSAGRAHFAEGRAAKLRDVSVALYTEGSRRTRQGEVWDSIAAKSARMDSYSDTGAAAVMYETHQRKLSEYVEAFKAGANQSGAAFAINGHLVGLDLFDAAGTLARQLPKLVNSYALDAIDEGERTGSAARREDCRGLLDAAGEASIEGFPAVGRGEDLRLTGKGLHGAALVDGDRLVHLCLFTERDTGRTGSRWTARLARASQRGRIQ